MHMFQGIQNLYEVLKIPATAEVCDMKKAYRSAALWAHPDKEGGSKEAFHVITVAFEILSCPSTRALYDRWLSQDCHPSKEAPNMVRGGGVSIDSKRSASQIHVEERPVKRRRVAGHPKFSKMNDQLVSKLDTALEHLRSVLQSMTCKQRKSSISNMTPQVRSKLLAYMERFHRAGKAGLPDGIETENAIGDSKMRSLSMMHARSASTYEIGKVYAASGLQRIKYQANIHVKGLRLYTREQSSIEAAVDHQIVLVQLKNLLNSKSIDKPHFWNDHRQVLSMCNAVLRSNGTSEAELGLRAWVHMRATRWLGHRYRMASSATTLANALEVHGKLLRARSTSWEALRAEWVHLMVTRRRQRLSLQEAEAIADRARCNSLQDHLMRAVKQVEHMLGRNARTTS